MRDRLCPLTCEVDPLTVRVAKLHVREEGLGLSPVQLEPVNQEWKTALLASRRERKVLDQTAEDKCDAVHLGSRCTGTEVISEACPDLGRLIIVIR
jgi:hypothetical protein